MKKYLNNVDKPKKGGKKGDKKKGVSEGPSTQVSTPNKQKTQGAATSAPKKQKLRKMTLHPSSSSTSNFEYVLIGSTIKESSKSEDSQSEDSLCGNSPPPSPIKEVNLNDKIPTPPPSHTHTSIAIIIAPSPPPVSTQPIPTLSQPPLATVISQTVTTGPLPVSSQPQPTIPISTPIFIDSTIVPTISIQPFVSINIYDTEAEPLGFLTHVSPPISSINHDDPDMVFCDDEDKDIEGFNYSPFQIRTEKDDVEHITTGQLQSLHEKIDQLLQSTKASSTDDYAKAAVESLFERIMKQHNASVDTSNKVVANFAEVCMSTTEKVDKLIEKTTSFMENFQTTYNSNTTSANEALKILGSLFKTEKTKLQELRSLKDSLALKTDEAKVLSTKLEALEKQVNDQLSKRAFMRSCISDVTCMLSDIIETRDSMITITMHKHLQENLRPIFSMLHRLEGVSDQAINLNQVGESMTGGGS
ncbi:unnamed protein product [Lactuca saligna]|uniref:Uncharacterized protein n=1 Tax=Lactuca saligna TaxID=75948 RepID=A0AA35Z2C8_LACSI|nr:unnamed protein product [Lactuca saligna]